MSYTEAEIRAFVMDCLARSEGITENAILAAAWDYRIDPVEVGNALDALLEATWINFVVKPAGAIPMRHYRTTYRGRECRRIFPPFIANVEPFDMEELRLAFEESTIPDACSMDQLRALHSRTCGGSHE